MNVARNSHNTKETMTFQLTHSPLVVDVWHAQQASDVSPILLVHGWGSTGNYWEDTARKLSQTATVIVPDLPGTGRSQPVKHPQDMYDQVETLACLLDMLELEKVQIVAHSMGSAMSVLLAAEHPERIERMVLTALAFFMTDSQRRFYHAALKVYQGMMRFRPNWLVDVPGLPRVMATQYFYRVPNDKRVLRQGLQDYIDLDRHTAMACANNATDDAIQEAGTRVQAPTRLIVARQDNMMPNENVQYTADSIPNCTVHWIDDCGHIPMIEKPDLYMSILNDFLEL